MPGHLNTFACIYLMELLFNGLTNRSRNRSYLKISSFTEFNAMQLITNEISDK
jgi:hypothetical protein